MKPLSPNADNPVRILEEELRLNGVLVVGECVGERLTLEVVLNYECKFFLLQITVAVSSFGKNGSLGEFYTILVVDWVYYNFVNVKGVAYGGVYRLGFCGRPC